MFSHFPPGVIYKCYQKYGTIESTADWLGISEEKVRNGLAEMERIQEYMDQVEEEQAERRREPDSLPNALLSTIAVLGFIFFPITLVISLVVSPSKHKKRRF